MLKFFISFGLVSLAVALGVPSGPPASPDNLDDEEYFYSCFTSITCVIPDAEEHKGLEDCFETLNDDDMQMVLDWLDSDYKASDYTGKFHAIEVLYCQTDTITRKDRFRIASQGTLDITSVGCSQRYGDELCERWANVLECTVGVVEDLKEKKKCDIKEFEESGLQMKEK
ncbi:hypothetical protein CDAR_443871 [Caerostris darwini]|uniref:DUF19 domain-containing protein n=1 Tax=Caerostris darwini TaxID=1538125 RepID=A0AAV4X755_9ARAC|nr:hypothetical protein CDAR_443871 [Caerostris darwini]